MNNTSDINFLAIDNQVCFALYVCSKEVIKKYKDEKFKRAVGIPRELFEILVEILYYEYKLKHIKGGRKPKLSVENILVLYLSYNASKVG